MKSKTPFAVMLESINDPILKDYEFQAADPWRPTAIPHHLSIRDRKTGFAREVHLQIPVDSIGRLDTIVILLADGQLTHLFSRNATDRLRETLDRPMAFIGLSCSDNGLKRKDRAEEYLGEPGVSLFDNLPIEWLLSILSYLEKRSSCRPSVSENQSTSQTSIHANPASFSQRARKVWSDCSRKTPGNLNTILITPASAIRCGSIRVQHTIFCCGRKP